MSSGNPFDAELNDNPFQAPQNPFDNDGIGDTHAEAVRQEHLSHEASVKSIGLLYMLGGIFMVLATMGLLFAVVAGPGGGAPGPAEVAFIVILPVLAILQCITAVGLRRLRGWARIPSGILSAIGLIGFPIGTLINGYILYLLFSQKGSMVFSEEYQEIMAQTPHIKYKTSIIVWIFLGLLVTLIAIGIAAAIFGG